ncbi:DUF3784 domain-containing protein [Bacteroides salyersiae]|nr:DUF3784 domain-containing protein [Bacteroides salyersiae]
METTVLITAFILIGLGVLVKRFPILIAGYNTMSKEEKMNVDVKGLSAFMCYSLVGMGTVPCTCLLHLFGTGTCRLGKLLSFPSYTLYSVPDSQGE